MRAYRLYLVVLFAVMAACFAVVPVNLAFMHNVGELATEQQIALMQQNLGGLFGPATSFDIRRYKLALVAARAPAVVALGSSRVMQFREQFFSVRFANLGGTVSNSRALVEMATALAQVQHVQLVIVGMDFWWTNQELRRNVPEAAVSEDVLSRTIELGFVPVRWLVDHKFGLEFYRSTIRGGFPARIDGIPAFGASAALRGNGFARDGSYVYNGVVYGLEQSTDVEFREIRDRIDHSIDNFSRNAKFDEDAIADMKTAIARLRAAGKKVVVFVPPLANAILSAVRDRGDQYAYLERFYASMAQLGADAWYDFHDPAVLHSSDCEFIDGIHGGDVTYARILRAMTQYVALTPYVRTDVIDRAIAVFDGYPDAQLSTVLPNRNEVDFLGIGCDRARTMGTQ